MTERRYTEAEVAAIFEAAAEEQQAARRQLAPSDGMTLKELQDIGREVGIPGELVAQAARSLDYGGRAAYRTFLGLPIGVARTVELDRKLSDAEWEQLVGDLRETFDAAGRVRYDGPFRQWTNGNLQALLEPTPAGHRVRLRTVKGEARGLIGGGLAILGMAAVTALIAVGGGDVAESARVITFLSAVGLGMLGVGALRLPGWARLRRRQMEGVAARLALSASSAPPSLKPPT